MTENKNFLSQEEIDALLETDEDTGSENGAGTSSTTELNKYLEAIEQDAIGEIGNITLGSAATALSTLLGKKVEITTPKVSVIHKEELKDEFPDPHVAINVNYVEGFNGINLLMMKIKDAQVIANLMMGGDGSIAEGEELSEIHTSAVQEAMNQMMGSSATSMSTMFNRFVNISPPGVDIVDLANGTGYGNVPMEEVFIKIAFRMTIGDLIDSTIMQLLPTSLAKEMVQLLMDPPATVKQEAPKQAPIPAPAVPIAPAAPVSPTQAEPIYQQPVAHPPQQMGQGNMPSRNVNVQPAQFSNFGPSYTGEHTNLNLLMDIPLRVTVELGRTKKTVKDLLDISEGSIIELDKLAGEPVDILVNNKLIAKGEVVVIDENFGVRVTDIVNQWERLEKLR